MFNVSAFEFDVDLDGGLALRGDGKCQKRVVYNLE